MERDQLDAWLAAYGQAWEERDTHAFVRLFAPGVLYYWTPFEEPKRRRESLAEAFGAAVGRQEAIRFRSTVLSAAEKGGIAHWSCSFDRVGSGRRVRLDGIFQMEFDQAGQCEVFREWWHSDEIVQADLTRAGEERGSGTSDDTLWPT